jgi:sugar phosphate isomerase/epimerase
MKRRLDRRRWLAAWGVLPAGLAAGLQGPRPSPLRRVGGPRVRISLNAYSFNEPLQAGRMSLGELLEFCAHHGFDGVDLTGYYFQGYPDPPPPDQVRRIKRDAFLLGLEISGTGVRNDFTVSDPHQLQEEIGRVRTWLGVARDLGAPNLRIFAGRRLEDPERRPEVTRQVVEALRVCLDEAERKGVMLALQNHFEFVETPEQLLGILAAADSPWLAVNLDIGSFRGPDPYLEIEMAAPYAVAWQIKELVYPGGEPEAVDLDRVAGILERSGYRGFVLLETLEGDPVARVPPFLDRLRRALSRRGLLAWGGPAPHEPVPSARRGAARD